MRSHKVATSAVWLIVAILLGGLAKPIYAAPARRDMAPIPLLAEDGYNPGPLEPTTIQMVTETVTLDVATAVTFDALNQVDYQLQYPGAQVSADFLMRNPEATAQTLRVGFPLLTPPAFGTDTFDDTLAFRLQNLRVFVNDVELPTEEVLVGGQPWRAWTMTFQPGDVRVRVTYMQMIGDSTFHSRVAVLGYVLQTGAGWAGLIEQAEIRANFPYPVETLFLADGQTGYTIEGNSLIWRYELLEPTPANDLRLIMIAPDIWADILHDRQALQQEPTEAAYAALANAYDWTLYSPAGRPTAVGREPTFANRELAQVTEVMYQKALEVSAADTWLFGDYATFLAAAGGGLLPSSRLALAADLFDRHLRLHPDDEFATWHYTTLLETGGANVPDSARARATLAAGVVPTVTPEGGAHTQVVLTRPPSPTLTQRAVTPVVTIVITATPTRQTDEQGSADLPGNAAVSATPPSATPDSVHRDPAVDLGWEPAAVVFVVLFALIVGGVAWLRSRRRTRQ